MWTRYVLQWARESQAAPRLGFALTAVLWLVGLRQNPGPWVLLHYAALAVACWCLCEAIRRQWVRRPLTRLWYLLPIAAVMFTYGTFDGYESVWTSVKQEPGRSDLQMEGDHGWDSDLKGHFRTVYRDSRQRWGGSIYWRELDSHDADGHTVSTSQGPMTETNKPHGHWRTHNWSDFKRQHEWYWYGELITEGEWHLRDRR